MYKYGDDEHNFQQQNDYDYVFIQQPVWAMKQQDPSQNQSQTPSQNQSQANSQTSLHEANEANEDMDGQEEGENE